MSFRSATFPSVFFHFPEFKEIFWLFAFQMYFLSYLSTQLQQSKSENNKQSSGISLHKAKVSSKFSSPLAFLPQMTINWSLFCGKFHLLSFLSSCVIYQFLRFYVSWGKEFCWCLHRLHSGVVIDTSVCRMSRHGFCFVFHKTSIKSLLKLYQGLKVLKESLKHFLVKLRICVEKHMRNTLNFIRLLITL